MSLQLELKEKIEAKQKEVRDAGNVIIGLTRHMIPNGNGLNSTISDWDCNKSPFGLCAYNNIEDPYHDSCYFCGKPNDRQ